MTKIVLDKISVKNSQSNFFNYYTKKLALHTIQVYTDNQLYLFSEDKSSDLNKIFHCLDHNTVFELSKKKML